MKLFISYAPKDEIFRDELKTHLALLKRQGVIDTWDAKDITAGADRAKAINNNLKTADIILLLISPDFIASDYCYDTELRQALDRHRNGEARVIPIILRSCAWEAAPFSELQALPRFPGEGVKPITLWSDRDGAFLAIVGGIRKVAREFNAVPETPKSDIQKADWVEEVRSRCCQKILYQHSTIQLLNQAEIGVDQLYVDVWLLDRSPRTFQVSGSTMLKSFDLRNDRLGLGDRIKRNEGIKVANNETRLLILGKPGAGKTTFLKHLAVDCSNGKFQPNLIPVLIELRRIRSTEWKLLDAISEELRLGNQQTQTLLEQGKLLILMDGLDEVPTNSFRRDVQEQVRRLSQEPQHSGNQFILTCRTQIIEVIPQGFTSVEVADFNTEQVEKFVKNWFRASRQTGTDITQQWQAFSDAIRTNPALKELTVTPVLLGLMCLVLQDEGDLPAQTASLYRKGIRLLLEKWNDRKEIPGWEVGNEVYRKLELEQKEALLIEIAARKFENPDNFVLFEQKDLTKQIAKFLKLANARQGEAVLQAIEAQHGLLVERAGELWSFSHLTFQEFFTAQWLAQLQQDAGLAAKIADKRWQEVVKLAVKSQQPADRLLRLIKQAIDYSVSQDAELQEVLTWVQQKAEVGEVPYKPAASRAFYFTQAIKPTIVSAFGVHYSSDFAHDIDPNFHNFDRDIIIDKDLDGIIACAQSLDNAIKLARIIPLYNTIAIGRARVLYHTISKAIAYDDLTLMNKLKPLLEHLPDKLPRKNAKNFRQWWEINGQSWIEQLRQIMIEHRNIGHDWQFTKPQIDWQSTKLQTQTLQQMQALRYHDANKFLVELLEEPEAISDRTCQEIEDNLLLPIATLRKRLPEMYGE